jgi:hypothetical protein
MCGGLRAAEPHSSEGLKGGVGEGQVLLTCTPENEARVFEALSPPPLRDWGLLGRGRRPCRIAVAVGRRNSGPHGRLEAWVEQLAAVVPGASLLR